MISFKPKSLYYFSLYSGSLITGLIGSVAFALMIVGIVISITNLDNPRHNYIGKINKIENTNNTLNLELIIDNYYKTSFKITNITKEDLIKINLEEEIEVNFSDDRDVVFIKRNNKIIIDLRENLKTSKYISIINICPHFIFCLAMLIASYILLKREQNILLPFTKRSI